MDCKGEPLLGGFRGAKPPWSRPLRVLVALLAGFHVLFVGAALGAGMFALACPLILRVRALLPGIG